VKEDLEYHQVACHLAWSRVPLHSRAAQLQAGGSRGQNGWNLAGASRNVAEILSYKKPSDTQRSRRSLILFDVIPDELTLKILGPKQ
jgi:hypothetical protein